MQYTDNKRYIVKIKRKMKFDYDIVIASSTEEAFKKYNEKHPENNDIVFIYSLF